MSSPPPPAPGAVPKLEPPTDPGTAANSMRDKIIAMQAEGGIDGKITQYPTAYKPPEPANAEATSVIVQFVKFKKKDQPPFTVVINVADPSLIQAVITPPPDGKGEPKAVSVQPLPAAPTPEKPNADPETPKNQPGTPESPNGKDKPNSEPKGEDEDDDDEQSPTNSSTGASPAMTTYYDIKQNPIYTGVLPPPTSKAEKSSNNTALIGATAAFAALFALSLLALFLLWRRRKKTTRHDPETYSSPTSSLTEKAPAIVGAAPRGGNVEDGPVPDFYLVPQDDNTLSNAFNGSYRALSDHAYEYYSGSSASWDTLPRDLKDAIRSSFPKGRSMLGTSRAEIVMGVLSAAIWNEERKGEFLPGGKRMQASLLQNRSYWNDRDGKVANLTSKLLSLVSPLATGREELRRASLHKVVSKVADLSLLIAFQRSGYFVFENADAEQGVSGGIAGGRVVEDTMQTVGGGQGNVEGIVWPGFAKGGDGESIVLERVRVVGGV